MILQVLYLGLVPSVGIALRVGAPLQPRTKNQGLLSPLQIDEARKAHPRDPGSSAARLGPRALSAGVVELLAGVLSLSDHIFIGFIQSMLIDCIEDIV